MLTRMISHMRHNYFKQILISTKHLNRHVEHPRSRQVLRVLDCTPNLDQNEFYKGRIPGSIYFDYTNFKNEEELIEFMKKHNIRVNDIIVCYDRTGIATSPYVWFNLSAFGAKDVFVLDGGFPSWVRNDFRIEEEDQKPKYLRMYDEVDDFGFKFDNSKFVTADYLLEQSSEKRVKILDASSKEDFENSNISNSLNLDSKLFLNDHGCFKRPKEIKKLVKGKVKKHNDVVFTSRDNGISACINLFALELAGIKLHSRLYNGYWDEIVILLNIGK